MNYVRTNALICTVLFSAVAVCGGRQTAPTSSPITRPSFFAGDAQSGATGQHWEKKTDEHGGVSAHVATTGQTPDGAATMTFDAQCSTGEGGVASLIFTVLGAAEMKNFDFDNFEGPDAPAQHKPLLSVTVHRAVGGDVVVATPVSGSYTVTDKGFQFEASMDYNKASKVTIVTDALIAGGSSLLVKVRGFKDPRKSIVANFSTEGASAVLGEVMKGCGAHH
ncbi:MAG TPA: hypothetical protein VLZ81_16525 [Blastocatellia bacterium]|nr:hypothetical protein [Blastocatellia bacterium]